MSSILNHVNDDFIETYKLTVNETFCCSKPTEMSRGCSNRHLISCCRPWCLPVCVTNEEGVCQCGVCSGSRDHPLPPRHSPPGTMGRLTHHSCTRVTCHVSRVSTPALTIGSNITIRGFVVKKVFQWKTAFQNEGTNTITCNTEHLYSV